MEVTQLRLLTETGDELVHRLTGFLAHLAERIALEGDVRLGPEVVFEDSGGPDVDVVLVLVFGALETFVDVLYGRSSVVQEQGAFPGRVVDVLPGKVELQGPAPLSPALSDDVSGACDVQTADWSSIVSHVQREENREREKLAKLLLVANVMFYPPRDPHIRQVVWEIEYFFFTLLGSRATQLQGGNRVVLRTNTQRGRQQRGSKN